MLMPDWGHSLRAALLVAVIAALRLALLHRLPRRAFAFLWDIAALRFLLPFSLPSPLSIFALRQPASAAPAVVSAPSGTDGFFLLPAPTPAADLPAAAPPYAAYLWALGAAACAIFFLWGHLRCLRRYRASLPVDSGFAAQWMRQHPLRRTVRLRCSDRISSPLTYGVLRPVILLPSCSRALDGETLSYVLTHELWHIRRSDAARRWLFAAVLCLHWFNPLAWAFYLLSGRDLEMACDEAVVRSFGSVSRSAYARALLRLEQARSCPAPFCIGFCKTAMEERMISIMNFKALSAPTLVLTLFLTLGVPAVFATTAPQAEPPAAQPTSQAEPAGETPAPAAQEAMLWPTSEQFATVTASFGSRVHPATGETIMHDHICISGDEISGSDIYAALSGTVTAAGWADEAGYRVEIAHADGLSTVYAHCSDVLVSAGDEVKRGDVIARVGATGNATGSVLAFGVFQNGEAVDPLSFFPDFPTF